MINKSDIEKDLRQLNGLYNSESDPIKQLFFAKLAIIELSSWIEGSLDAIALRTIKGDLRTLSFRTEADGVVNKNYGFKYKANFLPMLGKLAGLSVCERLEAELQSTGVLNTLKSELSNLTIQRNLAAHVGIRKATYDSPSVTQNRFRRLYPIVKSMYSWAAHI